MVLCFLCIFFFTFPSICICKVIKLLKTIIEEVLFPKVNYVKCTKQNLPCIATIVKENLNFMQNK